MNNIIILFTIASIGGILLITGIYGYQYFQEQDNIKYRHCLNNIHEENLDGWILGDTNNQTNVKVICDQKYKGGE
jgi:hypothetical protein